jgi:AraC-like DNA-binding protein
MISAYSAIVDTTATKIRYSIIISFMGFSKPTMGFVLHVPCVLLCKNCSGRNELFPAPCQNLIRNRQGMMSAAIRSRPIIMRMIPANPFKQTLRNQDRAESVDIWKARQFIEQHSDEEISLTKVAKGVNINPTHLSEKFKQVTGVNFVDYVARTRFDKACERLVVDDLRISEIAFEVGFQSLSQFNRVFKKLSGKSPTVYRAAQRRRPKTHVN